MWTIFNLLTVIPCSDSFVNKLRFPQTKRNFVKKLTTISLSSWTPQNKVKVKKNLLLLLMILTATNGIYLYSLSLKKSKGPNILFM
jgi:hypothetical protein